MTSESKEAFNDELEWEVTRKARIAERKARYAERSLMGKIQLYLQEFWLEEKRAWANWNYHRRRYFEGRTWRSVSISSGQLILGLLLFFIGLTILLVIKIYLFGWPE